MLLFVFKALHGTASPYIADLIQTQKSKRTLRSESLSLLKVPRTYRKMRGDAPRLIYHFISGSAPLLESLNNI